jgi:hypothetical protein
MHQLSFEGIFGIKELNVPAGPSATGRISAQPLDEAPETSLGVGLWKMFRETTAS